MFKPGEPRPANAGRRKGTKNKFRLPSAAELQKKHDFNSYEELIKMAKDPACPPETRRKILSELTAYTLPRPRVSSENTEIDPPSQTEPESEIPTTQLLSIANSSPTKTAKGGN